MDHQIVSAAHRRHHQSRHHGQQQLTHDTPPLRTIGILWLVAAAEILPLQFCFASSDRAADNVISR
jgi:hypothetical protein